MIFRNEKWQEFFDRWTTFFHVVFNPWTLLLLASTIGLVWYSIGQEDRTAIAIYTILLTLSSGLLGGFLAKQWIDVTEEGVLKARGRSAIRSLKLLLGNVSSLERRVAEYIQRYSDNSPQHDVIKVCLEEVVAKCVVIEEEALNSIENWTDIIPEADVKTQIGIISDLRLKEEKLTRELNELKIESQATQGKTAEQIEKLKKEINNKKEQLAEAKTRLLKREFNLRPGLISGFSSLGLTSVSTGLQRPALMPQECDSCGKSFYPTLEMYRRPKVDQSKCSDCCSEKR